MSRKIRIHKLSFSLIRGIGLTLAVILTVGMLLSAGMKESYVIADSNLSSTQGQDQNRIAAQKKFDEGKALSEQGTAESLRMALKKFEEALPLWRAVGDRMREGVTLSGIGVVYTLLGEHQKALDFYNQALSLHRAAGNRGGESITLDIIGQTYFSLGNGQKALDFFNQALPLQRAIGDRKAEALTLNRVGATYILLNDIRKAIDFHTQALPLLRAVGDRSEEAKALTSIGSGYKFLGENEKALDFFDQALPLVRAAGDRATEGLTLMSIGALYASLGEYQKALDFLVQARSVCRAAGNRGGEVETLKGIGAVYKSLGEHQKALDFFTEALTLVRASADISESSFKGFLEGTALVDIGATIHELGDNQKALDFYTRALPLINSMSNHEVKAIALGNIGNVYNSLGEYEKAFDYYNQALNLYRADGHRDGEAVALYNIGSAHFSQREYQKALDSFDQALKLHRAIGSRYGEANALGHIAATQRILGQFHEARSNIESALQIIESVRAEVVSKELRASYFATAQERYEFYIDLLMQMHGQEPTRGHDAAALQASERFRARSLLDSLAEARVDIKRGADPKLLEEEKSLQQSLNAKAEAALKLSAKGADDAQLATLKRETDALTIELQQVQTQIRRTSPRYGALKQPQPLTLAEIQRQALDADTLLLEYSLGEERSFLWAVTPTTINNYVLPKREVVEAAAKRLYELLSNLPGARIQTARTADSASEHLPPVLKRRNPRSQTARQGGSTPNQPQPIPRRPQTSRTGDSGLKDADGYYLEVADLSRMLLSPVASQLAKKRLVIVADGMLHYIPFGALPDPNSLKERDGNWQPLLVEHEVVNLPSASTLAVLRRELAGRKPAARTLAVLADPVFTRDDERVKPAGRLAAQQTAQLNPANESIARKLGQRPGAESSPTATPGELRIKRLPFTRQEAEQIMALAPAGSGMKALDFQANRATATSEQLSQYRYIHFATHGLADSERPELSTILLSLYDEQGRPQDGFLRAHEVYNLELPAELVTLSACETGLGKLTKGEGLVSLTRGFMYAGAARVVVSLWSVNDRATSELMVKFYRRMLVEGERPAAALRAAQVEMWRDKQWEAPYYWAAFTLQGEWR